MYSKYGAILVNQDGQRICNEADPSKDMVPAMRKQRNSYILMDQATFDVYAEACVSGGYFKQEQLDQWLAENGTGVTVFAHGETLEEVAAVVNVDAAGLAATVERYNGFVAAGEDTDFGHPVSLPIGEGPYYLVEQVLRFSTTMGGLTIDNNLQVVDSMNKPIDGLFAAGEVIGGVHGGRCFCHHFLHGVVTLQFGSSLSSGGFAGGATAGQHRQQQKKGQDQCGQPFHFHYLLVCFRSSPVYSSDIGVGCRICKFILSEAVMLRKVNGC